MNLLFEESSMTKQVHPWAAGLVTDRSLGAKDLCEETEETEHWNRRLHSVRCGLWNSIATILSPSTEVTLIGLADVLPCRPLPKTHL